MKLGITFHQNSMNAIYLSNLCHLYFMERSCVVDMKSIFSWCAVIAWMMLIFSFSAQNGEVSGELSNRFMTIWILPILDFFAVPTDDKIFLIFLTRKATHMFVYFMLAILSANALFVSNFFKNNFHTYSTALIISFLYACIDEWHQSFTPGRVMAFTDVIIDTIGAILGLFIVFIIKKRYLNSK